jgi:hypothetical protein
MPNPVSFTVVYTPNLQTNQEVDGTNPQGPTLVNLSVNGNVMYTTTAVAPGYVATFTDVAAGTYALTAQAQDNATPPNPVDQVYTQQGIVVTGPTVPYNVWVPTGSYTVS